MNGSYPFLLGLPWLLGHFQVLFFQRFSPHSAALGLEPGKGSRLIALEFKWGVEKGKGSHCVCQKERVLSSYSTVYYFVFLCLCGASVNSGCFWEAYFGSNLPPFERDCI